MQKFFTLSVALGVLLTSYAQTSENLGRPDLPLSSEPVDLPPHHGELYDMSGGYTMGEQVADFTVYNSAGESLTLSDLLNGEKPVLLISGSVTCDKFANTFRTSYTGQLSLDARQALIDLQDQAEILFIYGMEAHPTSGACPSNCPIAQTTDTLVAQHETYADRLAALTSWTNALDLDFPFQMMADNPDNAVYNTFFERPNGVVGLNCDGRVGLRADWMTSFFGMAEGQLAVQTWLADQTPCYSSNASHIPGTSHPVLPDFTIAPNPSTGPQPAQILGAPAGFQLEVRDLTGRLLQTTRSTHLPILPSGPYLVTMKIDGLPPRSHRWIVE